MKYQDYYAALGVPRDADQAQIKKAYRAIAQKYHPDKSKAPDAEARFKDAAVAYATLKDADKRAAYDELGSRPVGEEFAPPPQWRREHGDAFDAAGKHNFDSFDDLDLSDLFAAMGRGSARSAHAMAGQDYDHTVQISLEDAHRGTQLNLQLQGQRGQPSRDLQVSIPAGVREGQKVRLRGKGGKGRPDAQGQGAVDGDIYLHIHLAAHPVFRPDHNDLYFDLVLSPWEAALGGDVQVPTLDGPVLLTVPPSTSSGRKLRLRGRGMNKASTDNTGTKSKGDLYAVVAISTPSPLSARERELFEQLASASKFRPRADSNPPPTATHATPPGETV